LWQRVDTEEDLRSAERKLDRWLVKPTDGIYARFNRSISIPISRQLIKFPITANMVTLFTLWNRYRFRCVLRFWWLLEHSSRRLLVPLGKL
jgi:hypothetical protein